VVHAIGFSDKEQLKGRYVDTTAETFRMTMDISCYSFTAVATARREDDDQWRQPVTLTYYGQRKVMPHYNVMGVAKAGAGGIGALHGRRSGQEGHIASMPSRPGRSRHWPPAA